jgi:hypothetical protein
MTPRAGVKTTPATERAFGALGPKRGPHFFQLASTEFNGSGRCSGFQPFAYASIPAYNS